jgi:hypothetical protein
MAHCPTAINIFVQILYTSTNVNAHNLLNLHSSESAVPREHRFPEQIDERAADY